MMIKLFEQFFKKEQHFSYTIAEYLPVKIDRMRSKVNINENEQYQLQELNEVEIDNIYKGL